MNFTKVCGPYAAFFLICHPTFWVPYGAVCSLRVDTWKKTHGSWWDWTMCLKYWQNSRLDSGQNWEGSKSLKGGQDPLVWPFRTFAYQLRFQWNLTWQSMWVIATAHYYYYYYYKLTRRFPIQSDPIQQPKLFVELEVPTIRPHALPWKKHEVFLPHLL